MRADEMQMLKDTLEILERGSYVKNGEVKQLKLSGEEMREAVVLLPEQVEDICEHPTIEKVFVMGRTGHFCMNSDSYTVARWVRENHPDDKVLVLNFANPVHPGGGVRRGARAQEEDLCRKSSLLLSLEDEGARAYYEYNWALNTYMGSDAIIMHPSVEIIKDFDGELLEDSVVVSVMTCAAPMVTEGLEGMSQAEYEEMFYHRIVATLKVAAHFGYRYLVLGAWGCGAFGNDAEVIARLYYRAFRELKYNDMPHESLFRQVYFAVLDRSAGLYNFKAFNRYFDFERFYMDEDAAEKEEALLRCREKEASLDRIKGSLFGGAMGDALGYPVEFMSEESIRNTYGKNGITEYSREKRSGKALISDDTQMTLFTADGLLVGETRLCLRGIGGIPHHYILKSYRDWLATQEMTQAQFEAGRGEDDECVSWLCDIPELFSRRAPGNTCIQAIKSKDYGNRGLGGEPMNDSKGCGGVMRVAPLALHYGDMDIRELDMEAAEVAALTHGHSLGYMSAAVLVHIISRIIYPEGERLTLKEIVLEALEVVRALFSEDGHIGELSDIVTKAVELSENADSDIQNIHKLGEGWVAEETLAIAVYCSLRYQQSFGKGIIAAVNHKGDSDSTGAVTGQILGALLGFDAIEDKWKKDLELYDVLDEMALDLCHGCVMSEFGYYRDPIWITKYIEMHYPTGVNPDAKLYSLNDALRNGLV